MKFLSILLIVVVIGIVLLLCFFSCVLASISDEYWEKVRDDLERKENGRRGPKNM